MPPLPPFEQVVAEQGPVVLRVNPASRMVTDLFAGWSTRTCTPAIGYHFPDSLGRFPLKRTGGFGDTWNDHGTILFSGTGGLYKVDASGGAPQPVTRAKGNEVHRWPSFLPDQDHFLYFVDNPEHSGGSAAVIGIYVGSLTSMESKKISSEIINAVQFASGCLFFVRDRSLMAQPFDLQRLGLIGKAEVISPEEIEEVCRQNPNDPAFEYFRSEGPQHRVPFVITQSHGAARRPGIEAGGCVAGHQQRVPHFPLSGRLAGPRKRRLHGFKTK